MRAAFEKRGAAVEVTEHEQHFTGASPAAYWDELVEHHPIAIPARSALERAGTYDAARAEAIAVLEAGNESLTASGHEPVLRLAGREII